MRAITVRQPWAWAIIHGGKDVENRSRNIAGGYRGPVAIHAGKVQAEYGYPALRRILGLDTEDLWAVAESCAASLGHIIGVVDLVGVHESRMSGCGTQQGTAELGELIPLCSAWAMPWDHHLVLANPRPLATPIPCRGRLGLWTVPDDIAAQIEVAASPKVVKAGDASRATGDETPAGASDKTTTAKEVA